jgi:hypothetical protein
MNFIFIKRYAKVAGNALFPFDRELTSYSQSIRQQMAELPLIIMII